MKALSGLPEPIQRRITNYKPRTLTNDVWEEWEESILEAVAAGSTSAMKAAKLLTFIAQFVSSLDEWGMEPPFVDHLNLPSLERHLLTLSTEGSQRTVRNELTRLGRIIAPDAGWQPVRQTLGRSKRPQPYTAKELRSHIRAASAESSDLKRRLHQVALALGANAGLDGQSIGRVTPEHLIGDADEIVLVGFDDRPDFPIGGLFAQWLTTWRDCTSAGQPLLEPDRINNNLYKLRADDGETSLALARLRTTFIVHLLNCDMPLRELIQIAGLSSPSSLSEYLVYCTVLEDDRATRRLEDLPPIPGLED